MNGGHLSVFGSALPPNKDDVLFRSDKDWETNAYVGGLEADWVYSNGFLRAAQHLAEHVCETGREQDFLIYPIIYLYRHHIELILKSIVESASYLLDRTLTDSDLRTLGRHDLLELWHTARPLLNPVCDRADNSPFPETELEGIDSYIHQIHQHDPDGQRFRYATIKPKGSKRLEAKAPSLSRDLKLINIRVFATAMEKLVSYLEGIEGWFADLEGAHAEAKRNI